MLPPKFNCCLKVTLFWPFEPCFTFCASRGDDDVDADDFDGDDGDANVDGNGEAGEARRQL